MNARCQFNIVGNGQPGVITAASINCETADGTDVLMYMGSSLLAFQANFKGMPHLLQVMQDALSLGLQILRSQML